MTGRGFNLNLTTVFLLQIAFVLFVACGEIQAPPDTDATAETRFEEGLTVVITTTATEVPPASILISTPTYITKRSSDSSPAHVLPTDTHTTTSAAGPVSTPISRPTSKPRNKGATGAKGDAAPVGDTSETGPSGSTGKTGGDRAPQGKQSDQGSKSVIDPQGKQGPQSEQGIKGSKEKDGSKGDAGSRGKQGEPVTKGESGEQGPQATILTPTLAPSPKTTPMPSPPPSATDTPELTMVLTPTPSPTMSDNSTLPDTGQCKAGASKDTLPEAGPYYHQIYRAFSSDGLTFTSENALLIDHASVPDATLRTNGEVWIYFVNGVPGQHGIWVAKSSASGAWDTIDCVRLNGEFNGNAVDPDIVLLSDGRYRLFYYEGHFVGPSPSNEGPHPIFSAISDDGLHFEVERELIAVETVTDPTVVQLANGRWLMGLSQGGQTLLADSDDGYDFELTGVVIELGGVPELAVLADGSVRLYVSSDGIKSVISDDGGQTWAVEPGTRLSSLQGEIIADPSLIVTPDGRWVLFYKVAPSQTHTQSG